MTKPDFLQELLGIFLRDSRRMVADLRAAHETENGEVWRQISHKLRGSCATVGARRMMRLTAEMEELPEAERQRRGGVLLSALEEEFRTVRQTLASEKRRAGAPFVFDDID